MFLTAQIGVVGIILLIVVVVVLLGFFGRGRW